jgi:crossover junction endodeoxyribonuclease RuvC
VICFGIDPGSRRTGWGAVRMEGSRLIFLDCGVIAASLEEGLAARLADIYASLTAALREQAPDRVFLESIFHHKSAKSALILGQARGVALLAAAQTGRELGEVSPAEVKKAVTGSGRAEKEQVQEMVRILLGLPQRAQADASDALAIAIAGAARARWNSLTHALLAPGAPRGRPRARRRSA